MVHQDSVQTVCVHPPVLYSTYEREYHESLGEHLSARVIHTYAPVTYPVRTRKGEEMV
jgi:hypothetical protein